MCRSFPFPVRLYIPDRLPVPAVVVGAIERAAVIGVWPVTADDRKAYAHTYRGRSANDAGDTDARKSHPNRHTRRDNRRRRSDNHRCRWRIYDILSGGGAGPNNHGCDCNQSKNKQFHDMLHFQVFCVVEGCHIRPFPRNPSAAVAETCIQDLSTHKTLIFPHRTTGTLYPACTDCQYLSSSWRDFRHLDSFTNAKLSLRIQNALMVWEAPREQPGSLAE